MLSDTVGFVRKLPHHIVAAFRATLEEVTQADLLLHVVDISNPYWGEQAAAVDEVLAEMGVEKTPRITVLNKIDLLPQESRAQAATPAGKGSVSVSARREFGMSELLDRIMQELDVFSVRTELKIPYRQAGLLSRLHNQARVTSEVYEDDGIRIEVELPRSLALSLRRYFL